MSYPPLSGPYPSKTEKDLFLFFSNSSYCEFSSVHVDRNGSKDGEGPLFQNFPGWWDVNLKTKPHRITGKRHMLLPAGFPCLGIISWNCIGTYWVLSWLVSSCWICRGTTRMLCFSTRLRPTRSESTVTRHFLGILRLESEFKGNIGGIPSHSITWLQDVAKGCSLGMQPTIVRKPLMKPGCSSEGYVCDYLVHAPRVQCVWEWTHWRVGEVSLRTQPDLYLEFSWPVHVQVLWFARSPNSMRSGTSFSGHYGECIEDQCVSICKTLDSF